MKKSSNIFLQIFILHGANCKKIVIHTQIATIYTRTATIYTRIIVIHTQIAMILAKKNYSADTYIYLIFHILSNCHNFQNVNFRNENKILNPSFLHTIQDWFSNLFPACKNCVQCRSCFMTLKKGCHLYHQIGKIACKIFVISPTFTFFATFRE